MFLCCVKYQLIMFIYFAIHLFILFAVSSHKTKGEAGHGHMHENQHQFSRSRDLTVFDSPALDGECFLQVKPSLATVISITL